MSETAKRSIQVNVRLSEQDFDLIKKASAKLWPNAVLTNSGILKSRLKQFRPGLLVSHTPGLQVKEK